MRHHHGLLLAGSLLLAACAGGEDDSDSPDVGPTTPVEVFNATAGWPDLTVSTPDGVVLADGIPKGGSIGQVGLPLEGALSLTHADFSATTDPQSFEDGVRQSWFFAGDGGDTPWRTVTLVDDFPEPIPGIAFVRVVLAEPGIAEPADIYIDGSVLFSGVGFDHDWPASFEPIGEGAEHPLRIEVPGDPDKDQDLGTFDVGVGYHTLVVHRRVGSVEALTVTVTEHAVE